MDRILSQVKNLPTLPGAVAQLSSLIHNDRANASDFEKIIKPDPALTTNLLKLTNSAYFGFTREITSVKQAVTLIGIKRLFEIAVSGAFSQVIPPRLIGYGMESTQFWIHSIATAVLSEKIAQKLGKKVPDLIFTAGLLHDIGKLLLNPFLIEHTEQLSKAVHQDGKCFLDAEKEVIGTNHAEVGALVAQVWNLPSSVEMAARWHHHPSEAPSTVDKILLDLVHAGNCLSHQLGFGQDAGELKRAIDPQTVTRLGLNKTFIDRVIAENFDQIFNMAESIKQGQGAARNVKI